MIGPTRPALSLRWLAAGNFASHRIRAPPAGRSPNRKSEIPISKTQTNSKSNTRNPKPPRPAKPPSSSAHSFSPRSMQPRPPFLPSSLPPFLPSSLPPFLPSSLPPFLPSSLPPFLPSSLSSLFLDFVFRFLDLEHACIGCPRSGPLASAELHDFGLHRHRVELSDGCLPIGPTTRLARVQKQPTLSVSADQRAVGVGKNHDVAACVVVA